MLEQLQNKGYYGFFSNENWTPNVNLYETEAAYLVCVDLAGVEKEKIEIEVVDGRLRLQRKPRGADVDRRPPKHGIHAFACT